MNFINPRSKPAVPVFGVSAPLELHDKVAWACEKRSSYPEACKDAALAYYRDYWTSGISRPDIATLGTLRTEGYFNLDAWKDSDGPRPDPYGPAVDENDDGVSDLVEEEQSSLIVWVGGAVLGSLAFLGITLFATRK